MNTRLQDRTPVRSGRTSKKMLIIAVGLMLLALVGYVLSLDESLQPGEGEAERMPLEAE